MLRNYRFRHHYKYMSRLPDDQDVTATYRGDATGAYLAGGAIRAISRRTSTLTAVFRNPKLPVRHDGSGGNIGGEVTKIVAGRKIESTAAIELREAGHWKSTIDRR